MPTQPYYDAKTRTLRIPDSAGARAEWQKSEHQLHYDSITEEWWFQFKREPSPAVIEEQLAKARALFHGLQQGEPILRKGHVYAGSFELTVLWTAESEMPTGEQLIEKYGYGLGGHVATRNGNWMELRIYTD